MHWLALFCLVLVTPSDSFRRGLRILNSNVPLQMVLKDGAQEKIANIRTELAVLESLSSTEQDEEKIHSFRTILSCANALVEIDRDMETFQVILSTLLCTHVRDFSLYQPDLPPPAVCAHSSIPTTLSVNLLTHHSSSCSLFFLTHLLQEHLTGTDDRLKTIAEGFSKEFLACKEQIEIQLNALL